MAYKFKVISDNLVECTDTENDDKALLTEEEAVLLGFVRFTYRGEPITKVEFAKLINKNSTSIRMAIQKYGFTTGEELIKYFIEHGSKRRAFTYNGKEITIKAFAELIGVSAESVHSICSRHNISTGEEVIAYIKSLNEGKISYQNQLMSVKHFSELIGRNADTIRRMIAKNGYTTGEQVLADFAERDRARVSKGFTYNGKAMSVTAFARAAGINHKTAFKIIRDTGINNGEELIEYYKEHCDSRISYMGKCMLIPEFIKLAKLDKTHSSVWFIIKQKGFTTGEQVIEYYRNKEKKLTFGGKPIQMKTLAEQLGKSPSAITLIMKKYGYSTGEEIIEHYRRKGLL